MVKAYNIKWDVDIQDEEFMEFIDLPDEVEIPEEIENDEEAISDWLSDEFEFCHKGFELRNI